VSERLEAVHKGLGDMQQLATGVGDLKRVLTNVKSRGVLGEYQLESILEQILTIDQYGRNVKTKEGSNALVEFAIKLPGRGDKDKAVWLPVDSKFPKEDFEALMDAYDQANPDLVEEIRKNFIKGIRKCALDINSKYVDPPNTTDFAILFLPFESLYAEVLRTPGLFESIQREHKIIITGPTTLSALLNSLQMGFRTLAIEKRSGEVWQLLGAVKTEFGNFGGILEKTQKKLQEASNVIEQAGVRSRAIEKKLRAVQELPKDDAVALLGKQDPLSLGQESETEE
jgi:DNA recombination protein RmuC